MSNFIIGFVMGLVVATVGFSNLASFADKQVNNVKVIIKENVK
jgi:hypothetical protein